MRTSYYAVVASLVLSGCSSYSAPALPTVSWTVTDSVPCSAKVNVLTQSPSHYSSRPAEVTITAPGSNALFKGLTGDWPSAIVKLPAEVKVSWEAPVRRSSEGEVRVDSTIDLTVSAVSFTGHISGAAHKGAYRGGSHDVDCASETDWEVFLPIERKVVVSSDPTGASIYHQNESWNVPKFIGTAPDTLMLLWGHAQHSRGFLFRKSGYEDLHLRLQWDESNLRAILHPLPRRRPLD